MGQQLGALITAVYGGKSEIDELKRRIERMERRLELSDSHWEFCKNLKNYLFGDSLV